MPRLASERGAILVHVVIAAFVLIGVLTWVVDYGVMWVGRRQAQNAADAGALAGAVAMAFDASGWTDRSETGPARAAAHEMALSNLVWGQAPDVNIATDVFFTNDPTDRCPLDAAGLTPCLRVDVYRNEERGNALPAIFGLAVGLAQQGVKATATARVAVADASKCVKPWAIPDKWLEKVNSNCVADGSWTPTSTFDETYSQGKSKGNPCPTPDVYTAPTSSDPGTGFTVDVDYGVQIVLKEGTPQLAIAPGVFYPVRLPLSDGSISSGANDYRNNIAACNGGTIAVGDTLNTENGDMIGPTKFGVQDLIALDPNAYWDSSLPSGYDNPGGVAGGCTAAGTCPNGVSPRIVSIPIFNTSEYYAGKMSGLTSLTVVNILGFFIDSMQGNNVVGHLTKAPGLSDGNSSINPASSFLTQIQLVR